MIEEQVNFQIKTMLTVLIVNTAYRRLISTIWRNRNNQDSTRPKFKAQRNIKVTKKKDKLLGHEDQALCKIGALFGSEANKIKISLHNHKIHINDHQKPDKLSYKIHNDTYY